MHLIEYQVTFEDIAFIEKGFSWMDKIGSDDSDIILALFDIFKIFVSFFLNDVLEITFVGFLQNVNIADESNQTDK